LEMNSATDYNDSNKEIQTKVGEITLQGGYMWGMWCLKRVGGGKNL